MIKYLVLVFVAAAQPQKLTDLLPHKGCDQMTIEKKCPNKNVTFWLYNDKIENYHLNEFGISTIRKAPFNDKPIKIILHGYTGNKTFDPNPQIRPEYLRLKYNVISIDYGRVAQNPCYPQSVTNSLTVADCFANFIHLLLNTTIEKRSSKKITLAEIHVIGFSLGGQVAGDMGHKVKDKYDVEIERITALDPAAPLFYGTDTRLSNTSAKYVDCLHTSAGIFGKLLPVATADFYFNALAFQPGCSPLDTSCNHIRAPKYFGESISTKDHKFCGRNKNLKEAVLVGEYVKPTTKGVYLVKTNKSPPYAKDRNDAC